MYKVKETVFGKSIYLNSGYAEPDEVIAAAKHMIAMAEKAKTENRMVRCWIAWQKPTEERPKERTKPYHQLYIDNVDGDVRRESLKKIRESRQQAKDQNRKVSW